MENMDKGLTVPKRVLILWLKITQMPQNLSAQFVCPSAKVLDFNEKRLHWASVVCGSEEAGFLIARYNEQKPDVLCFKVQSKCDHSSQQTKKYWPSF